MKVKGPQENMSSEEHFIVFRQHSLVVLPKMIRGMGQKVSEKVSRGRDDVIVEHAADAKHASQDANKGQEFALHQFASFFHRDEACVVVVVAFRNCNIVGVSEDIIEDNHQSHCVVLDHTSWSQAKHG